MKWIFVLSLAGAVFFTYLGLYLYFSRSVVREAVQKALRGRSVGEKLTWKSFFNRLWGIQQDQFKRAFSDAGIAGLVVLIFTLSVTGLFWVSFAGALIVALFLPRKAAGLRKKKLRVTFRRQLGDLTLALTSAVKTNSLLGALEYAINEVPPPIGGEGGELERLVQDYESLGSMEKASERFAQRIDVLEAYVLADSICMLDEMGTNRRSDEVLSLAQEFVKERERLIKRVQQSSIVIRGAFTVAMFLPLIIAGWLAFTLLPFREVLLSPVGRMLASIGVLIELVGLFLIYRKINSVVNIF